MIIIHRKHAGFDALTESGPIIPLNQITHSFSRCFPPLTPSHNHWLLQVHEGIGCWVILHFLLVCTNDGDARGAVGAVHVVYYLMGMIARNTSLWLVYRSPRFEDPVREERWWLSVVRTWDWSSVRLRTMWRLQMWSVHRYPRDISQQNSKCLVPLKVSCGTWPDLTLLCNFVIMTII